MENIFTDIQTVAIIGCSSNTYRTSHHIASYIQRAGFRMIPINPNETEVLGEACYDTIFDVPDDITIDMVDIFRNKKYTAEMVKQIVEWSKESGQKPVIWTQLNVSTPEAKQLADDAGLEYVENRCLMVEHRRIEGEL
ncbi:CoA-binding protein [Rhodohalobacter sp. 8-1]|uniref:CoA-binding protein n=1 Tax=Rhodohalobacter sp. 8-1 TaxID=3131972 RepID=UPI0030ED6454